MPRKFFFSWGSSSSRSSNYKHINRYSIPSIYTGSGLANGCLDNQVLYSIGTTPTECSLKCVDDSVNVGTVNLKCPLDASESGTTSAELEGSFSCVGMQCPPYIRGQGIASGCSSGVILNVGSTCETFCEQGWHLSSSSNMVNCSSSANGTAVLVEPLPECTPNLCAPLIFQDGMTTVQGNGCSNGTVLATNDAYGVRTQCFIGCDSGYSLSDLQNPTLPGIVICDSESNENASPMITAQCTENTCLAFSLPDRVVGFAFDDIPACT